MRQRIAADPVFAGMSAADRTRWSRTLMGTARSGGRGTRPRQDLLFAASRSAPALMVSGATTSPVYPGVVGAADPSRPKADLGDGTNEWKTSGL